MMLKPCNVFLSLLEQTMHFFFLSRKTGECSTSNLPGGGQGHTRDWAGGWSEGGKPQMF